MSITARTYVQSKAVVNARIVSHTMEGQEGAFLQGSRLEESGEGRRQKSKKQVGWFKRREDGTRYNLVQVMRVMLFSYTPHLTAS